ncbi:MAG: hypothetical protein AAF215_08370 [Cyanobacteria bacterium P01_A01_bin.123]
MEGRGDEEMGGWGDGGTGRWGGGRYEWIADDPKSKIANLKSAGAGG